MWHSRVCSVTYMLNLNFIILHTGEFDGRDFEQGDDGGYPFAGEHYGVAGSFVPSRSMEGWYPGMII
jgi:hypothetical protein